MDYLLTFAELSLGLAGVAALVAVFRDHKSESWNRPMFLGLISHAVFSFIFSLIPFIVNAFTKNPEQTWAICSAILSIQIISQIIMVGIVDRTSPIFAKLELAIVGIPCSVILVLNALDIYFGRSIDAYYIGILFHLLQGTLIFFLFILGSNIGKIGQINRQT